MKPGRAFAVLAVLAGMMACAPFEALQRSALQPPGAPLAKAKPVATPRPTPTPVLREDDPLYLMRRAMDAHLRGDWEGSNRILQDCLRLLQRRADFKLGEELGSTLFSESLRAHEGRAYERVFLHSLGMLNFAMLVKAEEALVEARRSDELQRWLRDQGEALSDDPLARLIAGKLYEHQGQLDDARIDLQAARQAYREGPMGLAEPAFLAEDLKRLNKGGARKRGAGSPAELWVIVYSGHLGLSRGAQAALDTLAGGSFSAVKGPSARLEPVMALAPMLKTATVSEKAGKVFRTTGRLAFRIAFLVGLATLTGGHVPEELIEGLGKGIVAEERRWDNLPAMIHAARLRLPAGTHRIRVVEDGPEGRRLSATVKVGAGSIALVQAGFGAGDGTIHLSSYLRP